MTGKYPAKLLEKATNESFGKNSWTIDEHKTVSNIEEAIQHIATYSSKHSEAIVSENEENIAMFNKQVDAAYV